MAEALSAAYAGVAAMQGEVLTDLRATHAAAEALASSCQQSGDLPDLYTLVARPIGAASLCGLPAADAVLSSLATLLDAMVRAERFEGASIALHLQALGLVLSTPNAGASGPVEDLISGLQAVTRRFSGPTSNDTA